MEARLSPARPKLQPLHIQSYYTQALKEGRLNGRGGLSPQTVAHHHRVMHIALKQAVRWRLLARNPAEAVVPPRPSRTNMTAVDEAQLANLLRFATSSRLRTPILIAATTGIRRGELLALRWADLNIKKGTMTICRSLEQTRGGLRFKEPKTARGRRLIDLPGVSIEALEAHRKRQLEQRLKVGPAFGDGDLIFPLDNGLPWPPDRLSSAFAALVRRWKGPKLRFHDLRHTHASLLLKQGVHPKIVSERLGHASVSITLDTYSHLLPGLQASMMADFDASIRTAIAEGAKVD